MVCGTVCEFDMVCGTVCAFDIWFMEQFVHLTYNFVYVCVCVEWFVHLTYGVWNGLCIWHMEYGTVCAFDIWFVHLMYGVWNGLCIWHMVCAFDVWFVCVERFVHLTYGVWNCLCICVSAFCSKRESSELKQCFECYFVKLFAISHRLAAQKIYNSWSVWSPWCPPFCIHLFIHSCTDLALFTEVWILPGSCMQANNITTSF
jgi:hypothetical protein